MPQAATAPRDDTKNEKQALALQKIRPELNLEKWPIWQPSKSKNGPRTRTLERHITLKDGSKVNAKVEIGFTQRGALTTEDQKTYYALVEHWEDNGRADAPVAFSLHRLAKRLNKRWGTNVIDALTASLVRLRTTPFVWENSYFDRQTEETLELLTAFSILSDLKIAKRKKNGVVVREAGYFRFNEFIIKNIQTNHTKPVLFHVVLNFKSEIAQLLYTHVDLMLAGNPIYERRTQELFETLDIAGKTYQYASTRKRILTPALRELEGVQLSKGGVIAAATLQRTKDGKDYKVVFRKGSAIAAQGVAPDTDESREVVPAPPPAPLTPAEQQGEELIRHFYKVFFGVEATSTRPRHRDLAASIVAQHGWDVAKYIIEYSREAAQETNFDIATFGAIAQYVSRGAGAYEQAMKDRAKWEQQREEEKARQAAQQAELEAYQRARDRYEQLPEDERAALTEKYRAELIAEEPSWAQRPAYGGESFLDSATRSRIVKEFIRQERQESREATEETGEETNSSPEN